MKIFKLSKLSIVIFSIFATTAVSANNYIGDVTVDGKNVSVNVRDNKDINISGNEVNINGQDWGLVIQLPGTVTNINGNSIVISGGQAALHLDDKSTTNIGSTETNLLDIKGPIYAIQGSQGGSQLNLTAKTINITSDGDFALHAQNGTQLSDPPADATHVVITGDDINIQGNKIAISAFSNSTIDLIGNLSVKAEHAIDVRGHSTVNINQSGDHTVKLDGDIVFETPGPKSQSGTTIDANVNINLTNSDSYWNGSVYKDTYEGIDPNDKVVDNLNVTLANGATWNAESTEEKSYQQGNSQQNIEALPVNNLTLDGGVVNIKEGTSQEVRVVNLKGSGGTINTVASISDGQNVSAGKFLVENVDGTPHLTVNAEGVNADDVTNSEAAMESFYASALGENSPVKDATLNIAEGDVSGALVGQVADGVVTTTETANTVNSSLIDIASSNYLFFRSQINDVSARLGDLRSMPKTAGAWVRYYGGQNKYSSKDMKEKYNTLQIGADKFINDNFYLGGTFSYTKGDGTLANGSTDDKNFNFGIYGGWMGEKGQFVDVIIKRHRLKSDFELYSGNGVSSGNFHNWATSASVEAGWRFNCPSNGFYAEPQVELQVGHVDSANYTTSRGVKVKQDGIDSVIGRAGVAVGYSFPESKGNAYAMASVLHDWKGEVKSTFGKDGQNRTYSEDLGGTWGEFALGGTYNPTKNVSAYGQFKTSTGSPVRNPWQVSVGLRYNF